MKLTRVTISGADDGVDPHALRELSKEFPWVEWGVLVSRSRLGQPRYPSKAWLATMGGFDDVQAALHFCGQNARELLGGSALLGISEPFPRVQLNGFSDYVLPELLVAARMPGVEFILQCGSERAQTAARSWHLKYPNTSILADASGGTGRYNILQLLGSAIPYCTMPRGYAGGITEDNVVRTVSNLSLLHERSPEVPFWIDLESGARTEDKFDVAKVRRILDLVKEFVRP